MALSQRLFLGRYGFATIKWPFLSFVAFLAVVFLPVVSSAEEASNRPPTTYLASGLFDSMFRQVAPRDGGGGPRGRPKYTLSLEGRYSPNRGLRNADTIDADPSYWSASLDAPLLRAGKLMFFSRLEYNELRFNWNEPTGTGSNFPERLREGILGLSALHFVSERWTLNYSLRAGSYDAGAGFGDSMVYRGFVGAGFQVDEVSAWRFGLDIASRRATLPELDFIPIPMAVYVRRVTDSFSFIVGVPFAALHWQPVRPLQLRVQFLPGDSVDAVVSYRPVAMVELCLRWLREGDNGFLDESMSKGDRLFTQRTTYSVEAFFDLPAEIRLGMRALYAVGEGSYVTFEDDTDREDALSRRDLRNGWEYGVTFKVRI